MNTLQKIRSYMAGRKALFPGALALSAISTLMGMLPYVLIWLIAKELFKMEGDYSQIRINSYAWWAVGSAIGSVVLYFLALIFSHLVAFRVEVNMRRESMSKVVNMPLGFFDNHTNGSIRKIIDDNASITHAFLAHQLPDFAGNILMPLVTLILILVFDWRLGLACLVPIVTCMGIMGYMMGGKGKTFLKAYMTSLEDMNTEAVEYVRGIPVVKVFQQSVFSFKNFYNSIQQYTKMVFEYTKIWEIPMSVYLVIVNGFVFLLVPIAILLIDYSGDYATVMVNLLFYVLLTSTFGQSMTKSMHMNMAFQQAKEALNRIEKLTDVKLPSVPKKAKKCTAYDVCFKHVSFTYLGAKKKAVTNVSFSIPAGKTIALVGSSGSGKTTIARLLPRFFDAETGQVCIGGIDVKEIEQKELMNSISFVFQNTKLFKTSLLENIKYGNLNASDEAVENAVDLAQCREIIDKLPDGLNTKIGTAGTFLSGGEQQRIALARAILKDAPIVVLDEATAFTDPENEHLIQKALGKLTKGKTILLIAHRLTSVMDADAILVVDNSEIVEQGSHHELLKKQGIYMKMWNEYQQSIGWTVGKEAQYV